MSGLNNTNNGQPGQGGGNGGPNGLGGPNNNNRRNRILMLVVGIAMLAFLWFSSSQMMAGSNQQEVMYSEFVDMLEEGKVESVYVEDEIIYITPVAEDKEEMTPIEMLQQYYYGQGMQKVYYTCAMEDYTALTSRLEAAGIDYERPVPSNTGNMIYLLLTSVLPLVLMVAFFAMMMKRMGGKGGMFNMGKNTAKVYVQKETGITFKDVAGEDEAKESLVEVVDFLHNPGKYAGIGARLPKGALLVGPPGTGKTLLAKAVAGEAGVPFFSLTGSDFVELYVGMGASRVRSLFEEANKNAPCIIFIDEIDAIGRSRDSRYGGGNEEREQTLNQLLAEMDGFDSGKGILILGATNRPEILDKALLRPGRFDRRIVVERPDLKGRVEILKVHAKNVRLDETVDLQEIALATSGAVGSDLANMINEAAINAVKEGRQSVSQKDLFAAVEQVLVGKEKKDRIMSQQERRIVSYHEVGHALISALQKNSEPVQKITIVPRTMGALGYVMHVPEEEKYLNTKAELQAMLVGLFGGRAAEQIVFDSVTTGASNDIEKATKIARAMVTQYGMSDKFGLMGLESVENQYLSGNTVMNCADATAASVDEEVMRILKESYEEALRLLRENREVMDKLAEFLIEKETITGKEFMHIFRQLKGIPEPEEPQDSATKLMKETEQAMYHETVVESADVVEDSAQSKAEEAKNAQEEFQENLEIQTAKAVKDAEKEASRGRFSNVDLDK